MALMKFIIKDRLAISKLDSDHLNELISGSSFLFNFMESILMADDNIFYLQFVSTKADFQALRNWIQCDPNVQAIMSHVIQGQSKLRLVFCL